MTATIQSTKLTVTDVLDYNIGSISLRTAATSEAIKTLHLIYFGL